ncbi:TPA: esterase/lipase family protein [Bacillus cereus]
MLKLSKVCFSIILCIEMLLPIQQGQASEIAVLPSPKEMRSYQAPSTEIPGTWQLGATPPNVELAKPPIVFVQGRSRHAKDWWDKTEYHGMNDMYELAYNAGYRTVFVNLYDSAGKKTASPYDNGKLLAQMLKEIYQHYGQKINIVSHSKGGVDAQAALIHYDAHSYVNKVVMLGTPNYGSYLADMAYSWYASWITDLVGEQDDGSFSLQTGAMEKFRKETDYLPNAMKNEYYTTTGTSWGPGGTALWIAGFALSAHGDNDGLVNVSSTYLPYGKHLFTIHADHDGIRKGSVSFPLMEPVLCTVISSKPKVATLHKKISKRAVTIPLPANNQFLAGGPLEPNKVVEQSIPIDEKEAVVQVMTKFPDVNVTLHSPSGKVYDKNSNNYVLSKGNELFGDVTEQSFLLKESELGNWKVQIQSPRKDAYFLVTTYKDSPALTLDLPNQEGENTHPLKIKVNQSDNYQLETMDVSMKIINPERQKMKQGSETEQQPRTKRDISSLDEYTLPLPSKMEPGTYNITIQVTGKKKSGKPFSRTIVKSIYIGK